LGLDERLSEIGRRIGAREAAEREALDAARRRSERLHGLVASAIGEFHARCREAGAHHLEVVLTEPRPDEKHIRSVQFDLSRGRHKIIVISKTRGEVTLVGPFHVGKQEGPCATHPADADADIEAGLGDLLEAFLEEAFKP